MHKPDNSGGSPHGLRASAGLPTVHGSQYCQDNCGVPSGIAMVSSIWITEKGGDFRHIYHAVLARTMKRPTQTKRPGVAAVLEKLMQSTEAARDTDNGP